MKPRNKLLYAGLALVLGAVLFVSLGLVPIKASSGHWAATEWLLHFAMKRSVSTHSLGIEPPDLDDDRLILMGAGHYEGGCRLCHGAPGMGMPKVLRHATPHPPELKGELRGYSAAELFYIVRHGVKFTAMPAWPGSNRDDEVWAVVAFLRILPDLDASAYQELVFGQLPNQGTQGPEPPELVVERCARCHGINGEGRGAGAFPILAAQTESYLWSSLRAYASGERHSGIMETIVSELTDVEMQEAASWYAAQEPPTPRQGSKNHQGESIATSGLAKRKVPACAACHGPAAHGVSAAHPRLSGQPVAYLQQQLRLFAAHTRGGTQYARLMQNVEVHALTEAEIRAVADFYSALRE